jgi:two-component system sensor histidine kinase KdpD
LLVVLVASSRGGRAIGVAASIAAFLCFNFFFLPPYYTLALANPLDWAVLAAFLATSVVAAQLLARARAEATAAERRAGEVERLSVLGAETLNAARAEDALAAIVGVIQATTAALRCDVFLRDEGVAPELLARAGEPPGQEAARAHGQPSAEHIIEWVGSHGRAAMELEDRSMRVGDTSGVGAFADTHQNARTLVLPLNVRERTVGVLAIAPGRPLVLDAPTRRFLEALSYYAALGVERFKLAKVAERTETLKRADEMKNAVLASVSHDLRTPLTTIKAMAHEIRLEGDDRAATIEEEADRLNRFVADLLDMSRLAGGALRVAPEVNAAEDLVGAALQRCSGAMGDKRVVASLDPSEPLLLGRFDFAQSLRVLGNLIDNAVKFAPAQSTIEVRAERDNGLLRFVVADRGPGIPPAEREAVFQPVHRPAGQTPDAGGAGLGLSIARGLAEAQGGGLRYEPRADGGSLFIFTVPAADLAVGGLTGS